MKKKLAGLKICTNFVAFLKLNLLFYYLNYKKMKKLVLSLAVIASMSFFACGTSEKPAEEAPAAEEAVEVVEEVVADSVAADSVAADTTVVVAEAAE